MSPFDAPWAMRPSTSRSRSDSLGNGATEAPPGAPPAKNDRSRRATSGAVDRLAGRDRRQGATDLVLPRALEQVAQRAGLHRGEDGLVVLDHGQHEHLDVGHLGGEPARGLDTGDTRASAGP